MSAADAGNIRMPVSVPALGVVLWWDPLDVWTLTLRAAFWYHSGRFLSVVSEGAAGETSVSVGRCCLIHGVAYGGDLQLARRVPVFHFRTGR